VTNSTALPSWWQIAQPHRDIRSNKRLDESIFAADLGQVARGAAPDDYQDPLRFFAGTYLTQGLATLLSDVLRELAGSGAGNRIIQIETPFGGGKTHTLLAIYHLIKHRADVIKRPEVTWLLTQIGLKQVPEAQVATIVGTDLSAIEPVVQGDGTKLYTLWGQIAYQLGYDLGRAREFYEIVRSADEARIAPGAEPLRRLLSLTPSLILMDELVTYIVPTEGVKAEDVKIGASTTLKDQTITFLQQLTQAVAQTPKSLMLLTIPGSKTELYGQAAKDLQQQVFTAANQAADVVGRIQTVRAPVQGDDIYEVLRRRLLEQPSDENARRERDRQARKVAEAYVALYRSLPNDVPQEVQEEAYIDRMMRAYPFHPDVVRILYERWGTLPDFQRTRGALRILGLVLADLFANNRFDSLILPAHLNLQPGDLRNELVRVLNNTTFNNVIDSDIAGSGAKAAQIDGGIGREHARFHPAVRTATTIFLWSFSGAASETRGATEAQIRVGALTPEMQAAIIGNILGEFRRKLWYLHEEGNTYRFDTRANLNRVIVQKEEAITAQQARKAVEDKVIEIINDPTTKGKSGGPMFAGSALTVNVRSYTFPKGSGDVADTPALGVAVLRPGQHAPVGESLGDLPPIVGEILGRYNERPRENRNVVVVLVPDTGLVAEAERAARRLLALRAAKADTQLALPVNQREELDEMLQTATNAFPQEVARIYRSVVIPADASKGGMERFDLGTRSDAFVTLAAKDRYLDALAPSLIASNHFGIWPKGSEAMTTQKLWDAFTQFPHLPMLAGKQVLIAAIERGCNEGVLGYVASGDTEPNQTVDLGRFGRHNQHIAAEIAATTWVVTATYARAQIVVNPEPVREIPPELLLDPTIWSTGSARRRLDDVWAALVNHYAPRPIDGKHVLAAALHDGVGNGSFRVSIDGGEPTSNVETIGFARINGLSGIELVRPAGGGGSQKTYLLTIDASNVELQQLSKITTGVIVPLKNQGARVRLRLVIDADAPQGIDPEVIELTVKETFKQLGLSPEYQQS
jgi:hypothetical protein